MNAYLILAAGLAGSVAGGALGARLSNVGAWKGALLAGMAAIAQFAIGELANLQEPVVQSLIYLAAVGIIGGRLGLGMTARQLSLVVIGSFLIALVAGAAVIYVMSR